MCNCTSGNLEIRQQKAAKSLPSFATGRLFYACSKFRGATAATPVVFDVSEEAS
jgi:hypothetical protein